MCFVIGTMWTRMFLATPGGSLNFKLIGMLILPAVLGAVIVYALRRFVGRRITIAVGTLLMLGAFGLIGFTEWHCQAAMLVPQTDTTDNDGIIRVLLMLMGYLTWASAILAVAMAVAYWAAARRKLSKPV